MNLWLIVPVKPFGRGKSRLSEALSVAERAALSRDLLARVIDAAQRAAVCQAILVISRGADVLAYADRLGAQTLREQPPASQPPVQQPRNGLPEHALNYALRQATEVARAGGADAVLVLPADLPWIAPRDICALYAQGVRRTGIVIAPSRDGGTNALLVRPPNAIDFAFGPDSFQRHCASAAAADLPCRVVESPRLSFDLDRPQDLWLVQERNQTPVCEEFACDESEGGT